jgi:GST-like protein
MINRAYATHTRLGKRNNIADLTTNHAIHVFLTNQDVEPKMTDSTYIPPKVWTWDASNGGQFANINRPVSGATHEKSLPRGENRFQLHSLATPNGVKVTILFEELLESGFAEAEYDAYLVKINEGDQFGSGFVELNPNSKIPALLDTKTNQRIFESASIMVYLAEMFAAFLPTNSRRTETFNWLFWQMGSAPFLGGGFGHFYAYAPEKYEYPINRYSMEVKRQLDVLDKQLETHRYLGGEDYTIADMATWPWYGALALGRLYDAAEFLDVASYKNVIRWATEIDERPAVKRGQMVNRTWGPEEGQVHERHGSEDFPS